MSGLDGRGRFAGGGRLSPRSRLPGDLQSRSVASADEVLVGERRRRNQRRSSPKQGNAPGRRSIKGDGEGRVAAGADMRGGRLGEDGCLRLGSGPVWRGPRTIAAKSPVGLSCSARALVKSGWSAPRQRWSAGRDGGDAPRRSAGSGLRLGDWADGAAIAGTAGDAWVPASPGRNRLTAETGGLGRWLVRAGGPGVFNGGREDGRCVWHGRGLRQRRSSCSESAGGGLPGARETRRVGRQTRG